MSIKSIILARGNHRETSRGGCGCWLAKSREADPFFLELFNEASEWTHV